MSVQGLVLVALVLGKSTIIHAKWLANPGLPAHLYDLMTSGPVAAPGRRVAR